METRPYQEEAINSLFKYFAEKSGNPIIAMPTGTGKSIVIAKFIERVMKQWPGQRILGLTHVKELIEQNANKIREAWSMVPIGIYSAGLARRDTVHPVIFGGVASVNSSELILSSHWDLVIIDEAHLVSPSSETMYGRIGSRILSVNPRCKFIGLSATPYRLKQGMMTKGGLFTDICYDLTTPDAFVELIAAGYMSMLIPKKTETIIDLSNVKITAGEFNEKQLQETMDKDSVTIEAVKEMIQYGSDRSRWLVFASGIEHAEHVANTLNLFGVSATFVSAKQHTGERNERINNFKTGKLRAIVNNNILTTGFDCPEIDFIGMLRPTMSPGLWVQMLGRGTRPAPGKQNCLVLDFAGNTKRLGPINDPVIPKAKSKSAGEAPVKICPDCGMYNHASVRYCDNCGHEFPVQVKIAKTAGEDELIRATLPQVEWFDVNFIKYDSYQKEGKPPMLAVSYHCGLRQFKQFICLEHEGYARTRARAWWRQFHWTEPPEKTSKALSLVSQLRTPKRIRVWVNKEYPEVMSYEH